MSQSLTSSLCARLRTSLSRLLYITLRNHFFKLFSEVKALGIIQAFENNFLGKLLFFRENGRFKSKFQKNSDATLIQPFKGLIFAVLKPLTFVYVVVIPGTVCVFVSIKINEKSLCLMDFIGHFCDFIGRDQAL